VRIRLPLLALLLPFAALLLPSTAAGQWGYPAPAWRNAGAESHLRFRVTPREASIYIDGYLAGTVSEFDGRFQRLHVVPGEHELVVYMAGYRALRQNVYLGPNATRTIEGTLERLPTGEPDEPLPQPSPRVRDDEEPRLRNSPPSHRCLANPFPANRFRPVPRPRCRPRRGSRSSPSRSSPMERR
jgi:hypothetical protein